jgi:hypothetical protein
MTSENGAEIGDRSIGRTEAERRELEAVGWEPKVRGAKTLWRGPAGGRWYAHYHAVKIQKRSELEPEEERLLHEHGFEREPVEGRELWSRYERGGLRLYMRSQALERARKRAP